MAHAGSRSWFWLRGLLWLICGALFFLAVRRVPLQDVWKIIQRISLTSLAGLLGLNLLIVLMMSGRWWLILRLQDTPITLWRLILYRLAGFSLSYLTPGPQFGGEPLQVYLLHHREGIPFSLAMSSVGLDKLLELIANYSFLILGLFTLFGFGITTGLASRLAFPLAGLLILLPLAYLLALGKRFSLAAFILHRFSSPPLKMERLIRLFGLAETQLGSLIRTSPLSILLIFTYSLVLWILFILEYGWMAAIVGAVLTPLGTIQCLAAARLAFLTPLPAGLGVLEAGQIAALQSLGFPAASGLSLSLMIRVRDMILALSGFGLAGALAGRKTARRRIDVEKELVID